MGVVLFLCLIAFVLFGIGDKGGGLFDTESFGGAILFFVLFIAFGFILAEAARY